MCLVLFAYRPDSEQPLVVAANRDEFYARPAQSAHHWEDHPDLLAGRDLSAGGTWLGVTRSGRFATVTNFAEEGPSEAPLSRGALTSAFLQSASSAQDFARHLHGLHYRGFNLLLWDGTELVYTSNRGFTEVLAPGIYGLANAELGASWPKVVSGRAALASVLEPRPSIDALLQVLGDRSVPADDELPRRGRPLELERRVAPRFIAGEDYGTRASTALIVQRGRIEFAEQLYGPRGVPGERAEFAFATGRQDA
ncbi:MAG: NRDE family protein [Pseudomonadales bacterium]